jgi:hypothetical protein
MTQRDRDRLVVLKKAQKKLITQSQAAKELELSERHVRLCISGDWRKPVNVHVGRSHIAHICRQR